MKNFTSLLFLAVVGVATPANAAPPGAICSSSAFFTRSPCPYDCVVRSVVATNAAIYFQATPATAVWYEPTAPLPPSSPTDAYWLRGSNTTTHELVFQTGLSSGIPLYGAKGVEFEVGSFNQQIAVEAYDSSGAVVDSTSIPVNTYATVTFGTTTNIERVLFHGGQSEVFVNNVCMW